jgi:hypothetical protein
MPVTAKIRSTAAPQMTSSVNPDSSFRHPAQEGLQIGPFLALLAKARDDTTTPGQNDG